MYTIKEVPVILSSISTIFPPNHRRIPMAEIPKNSLVGPAKLARCNN